MTKIKTFFLAKSVLTASILAASTAMLHAQARSISDSVYTLHGVEVTERAKSRSVTKLDVPQKFLPITVSTLNNSSLQERGIDNLNEALKQMTGIKPLMTYGGFQTFTMRGFGSPVMMIDGQRDERMNYSSSAPVTDLTAVESIELLKGPASVLYGHSAVGGILNIVRKAPSDVSHYNASVSYGSWNSKRSSFGMSGQLAPKLSMRADVGLSDRDGWRDNGDKNFSGYLALLYRFDSRNKLEFRTGYTHNHFGTETGIPVVLNDVYKLDGTLATSKNSIPSFISREQRFNDPTDFLSNEDFTTSLKYSHQFSTNISLVNTLSFTYDDINYFSTEELNYLTSDKPIYNTYYEVNGKRTYICLDTLQRTSPLRFSHITATTQNQMELTTKFTTSFVQHHLLAGWALMYLDRTTYTGYNNGTDVAGPGYLAKVSTTNTIVNQGAVVTSFSKANPRKDFTNGFYVQDLLELSPSLKALLAARLDLFEFRTAGSTNVIGGNREYTKSSLNWSNSSNTSFTYRGGLVYLPSNSFSVYGSFSTYFKPYRDVFNSTYIYVNKSGDVFTPQAGKEIFAPESGYQGEIGMRFEPTKNAQIVASAFYIHKENIRENVATVKIDDNGTQVTKKVYAQIGTVNSKGFDLDASVEPLKGLMVKGGYTFTMAQYGDFKSNPYVESDSRKNNYQTYSPKQMAFGQISYRVSGFLIGAGVNGSSEMFTNASNTISLPGYVVFDAQLGYKFKNGLQLRYNLKNIADKTYYEWALGNDQFVPSEGRSHVVTLSYAL